MKSKLMLLASLFASSMLVPAFAADAPKPFAKVNGVTIPNAYAEILVSEQTAQGVPNNQQLQNSVREHLVRQEVLAQEARKQGFEKKPAVTTRQEIAKQQILIGMYLDDWVKTHPVPEAQIRADYDRQVKEAGDREYKLRHIQTETEAEAVAVIKKLQAGGRFEELAKQSSKDEGTKDAGGDMGWGRLNSLSFGADLVKLDKGQFTPTPIKSQFGYHVVLVEDTRKFEPPAFEDVKDQIRQSLQQRAVAEHVGGLMKKAKVE